MSNHASIIAAVLLAAASGAFAKTSCPAGVTGAVIKAHPGARIVSCKAEKEKGKSQYEIKIKSGKTLMELDVAPDGAILQTEQKVAMASVPVQVMSAFSARYPKAKATRAEKQTLADGKVTYELAFRRGRKRQEATFDEVGKFIEEE
ncbi:MAG: hypothetical protein KGJ84_10675 [Elusimicrobia bacterium]|nr:hypothetical protein [Elusimicrobiota bacterium]